jgi:transcriptional regulator with XRE-family HTH domain
MPRAWVTSDAYSAVVAVLVEARKTAGLSQRDLAERLRKPRSYISKIETKERRVDVSEFIELAEALDVRPDALFDRVISALRK